MFHDFNNFIFNVCIIYPSYLELLKLNIQYILNIENVASLYNRSMGGVDLGDQLLAVYDPQVRSVKMWKKVFINLLLTATGNNNKNNKNNNIYILLFNFE